MATTQTVENGNDRRIDPERIERALTDDMTVREHAPAQYLVARDGGGHEEHLVDVDAGTCDGADAHYRDVVCVHMVRAAVHHAYRQTRNTRLVARVLAALREFGCPHDVAGCGGPTDEGQRGLPCEGCIAATPGHWVVYQRLTNGEVVEPDVDRGAGIATDGGTVVESTRPAETADRGCERCDDMSLADLKAARNPDGSVDHVCPECYRDGPGRAATTRTEGRR